MALLMTHKLSVTIAGIAVCHGLDIAFEAGQCWGILGKNGSGKTTLLQTLAGLRSSAAGEILINASPLSRITRKYIARSIGILFQDYDDMFERRRLAIAQVLAQRPSLYLLDEPTNHLDLNHQIGIIQTLREHVTVHRQTLVMVLHDINIAARFCDHLLLLFGNGDYRYGTKDEMMTEELLARLYDHPIRHIRDKDIDAFLPA
jgi:iron complex transport system ATP-binding protein